MSYLHADLSSLPLYEVLSAPLKAAIEAQQQSSLGLLSFIRDVGFIEGQGGRAATPRMVEFRYARRGRDVDGRPVTFETSLEIPMLAMISLPHLVIDSLNVNLLVSFQQLTTSEPAKGLGISPALAKKYPFLQGHSTLRVQPTARTTTKGATQTTRSYDMEITMSASSEEPADGVQRLLTALSGIMLEETR